MGMVGDKFWPGRSFCIIACFAYAFAFGHAFIFFPLPAVMFFGALASAFGNGITVAVIFHYTVMLLYLFAIIIILQFFQVMLPVFNDLFFYQAIHRSIGFYISRVNGLPSSTEHSFVYAKREQF